MTSHCPASSGNGDYLGRPPAASSPLVAKPLSSPPMWHPVNVPDIGGTTPDAAPYVLMSNLVLVLTGRHFNVVYSSLLAASFKSL
jgi:hypothetical protein